MLTVLLYYLQYIVCITVIHHSKELFCNLCSPIINSMLNRVREVILMYLLFDRYILNGVRIHVTRFEQPRFLIAFFFTNFFFSFRWLYKEREKCNSTAKDAYHVTCLSQSYIENKDAWWIVYITERVTAPDSRNTYDISPNTLKASFSWWVSMSGLRSPTNMWKCSEMRKQPLFN